MTWTIGEIKRNLIRIFLTKCRIKKLFCVFFIKNISLNMLFLPCLIDLLDVLLVIGVNHISLLKNFLSSLSCGHCGPSPGNNESAGKRKSCHITKGNPYLKNMLCEIAWVIAGAVALIMALDRAIRNQGEDFNSVYNERGLLIL